MNDRFGLHIRLQESLFDAVDKGQRLEQTFFQTVLMLQSKQFLQLTEDDIARFDAYRKTLKNEPFVHAAYWCNVTSVGSRGFYSLQKEIEIAEKLGFTNIVVHPGSFHKVTDLEQKIHMMLQALEILLKGSSNMTILLENSPHKAPSFSAVLEDFGVLFSHITSNRVKMCIDTAHAFVAGYDIASVAKVEAFVSFIDASIGVNHVGLLHCNDTKELCGSFIDKHAVPGFGKIGFDALYRFVHHPLLQKKPVIFELPVLDETLEYEIIQQFKNEK